MALKRSSTRLFRSGASVHVTIPKPLREHLSWAVNEELMVTVFDNKRIEIIALDKYIEDQKEAARADERRALAEAAR